MTRIEQTRYKHQSKEQGNEETEVEARGYKNVFPSSSFLREYVSLEGCELHHTRLAQRYKGLTLISDEPHHKVLVHLPLLVTFNLEARIHNQLEALEVTTILGHTSTTQGSQEHHYAV